MSMYTEQEAKAILDKAIKASKADQCTATLTGASGGNIRYALNSVSTSGYVSDADLAIEVAFGKRIGTATINSFDDVCDIGRNIWLLSIAQQSSASDRERTSPIATRGPSGKCSEGSCPPADRDQGAERPRRCTDWAMRRR